MKKTVLTVMATLFLVLMMVLSAGSALAGWGWEDCPPVSSHGVEHLSSQAYSQIVDLSAPEGANINARTNPGDK